MPRSRSPFRKTQSGKGRSGSIKKSKDGASSVAVTGDQLGSMTLDMMRGSDHVSIVDESSDLDDSMPNIGDSSSRKRTPTRSRSGRSPTREFSRMGHTSAVRTDLQGSSSEFNDLNDLSENDDFEADFDVKAATSRGDGEDDAILDSGLSSGAGKSVWKRREQPDVDQRVNLMDANKGEYSVRKSQQRKSLVDVFLNDDKNSDPGNSRSFGDSLSEFDYKSSSCCGCSAGVWKKLCLLLILTAIIAGAVYAIPQLKAVSDQEKPMDEKAVAQPETTQQAVEQAEQDMNLEPETNPEVAPEVNEGDQQAEENPTDFAMDVNNPDQQQQPNEDNPSVLDFLVKPKPAAVLPPADMDTSNLPQISRKEAAKFIILDQEISTQSDITNVESAPAKALRWISEEDEASLGSKFPGYDDFDTSEEMVVAERQLIERYSLAVFYFAMQQGVEDAEEGQRLRRRHRHSRNLADATEEEKANWAEFDSGWTRPSHVCTWPGVQCNGDKEVTEIKLTKSFLRGSLPREIFRGAGLPQLVVLDLSSNQLAGYLPKIGTSKSSLSGATPPANNLQSLSLQDNLIQGTIDPIIDLENLLSLNLSGNKFIGIFPKPMPDKMKKLETLDLALNELEGTMPATLGSMTSLVNLNMENNLFSGSIPSAWSSMSNMEVLSLAHCDAVDGGIPFALHSMPKLKYLSLQKTSVKGLIPSFLGDLTNLRELYLHHTDLTGDMPEEICNLVSSQNLQALTSDCEGTTSQVRCSCCTECFLRP